MRDLWESTFLPSSLFAWAFTSVWCTPCSEGSSQSLNRGERKNTDSLESSYSILETFAKAEVGQEASLLRKWQSEAKGTSRQVIQVEGRLPPVFLFKGLCCHVTKWNASRNGRAGASQALHATFCPGLCPPELADSLIWFLCEYSWVTGREQLCVEAQSGSKTHSTLPQARGRQTPLPPASTALASGVTSVTYY